MKTDRKHEGLEENLLRASGITEYSDLVRKRNLEAKLIDEFSFFSSEKIVRDTKSKAMVTKSDTSDPNRRKIACFDYIDYIRIF